MEKTKIFRHHAATETALVLRNGTADLLTFADPAHDVIFNRYSRKLLATSARVRRRIIAKPNHDLSLE